MTEVDHLLSKRMSRRQFLFGNRHNDELPIIPVVIGTAGIGLGVLGLGSPGPNSPTLTDAFIQKFPPTKQSIKIPPDGSYGLGIGVGGGVADALIFGLGNFTSQGGNIEVAGEALWNIVDLARAVEYSNLIAYVGGSRRVFQIGIMEASDNTLDKKVSFVANSAGFGGTNWGFGVESEAGIDSASGLASAGAQVGLPAGLVGAFPQGISLGNHRHAFSGRFHVGGFLKAPVLAGTPLKFARFKVANNFTVRRISVYALAAPVGNGETWGIVNAAGTLQGTAVALNGGVQENEAAQTTNLTGGTAYYLAQNAVAATTASTDVNLEVEYTMNV